MLLARAGWPEVLHQLLAGVAHDLNGRATALGGVAQLLALGDDASEVASYLGEEVGRLIRAARLLSLLMEAQRPGAAPDVPLAELMPDVVELHRRHRSLRDLERMLEVDGPLPAVRGGTGFVLPLVLLLLTAACREAERMGRPVRVRLDEGADGFRLQVEVDGVRPGGTDDGHGPIAAMRTLAEARGARLTWTAGDRDVRGTLVLAAAG